MEPPVVTFDPVHIPVPDPVILASDPVILASDPAPAACPPSGGLGAEPPAETPFERFERIMLQVYKETVRAVLERNLSAIVRGGE